MPGEHIDMEHRDGKVTTRPRDVDSDERFLEQLGYKQQLSRSLGAIESFASSFCAVDFVSSVRLTYSFGILSGGPKAMWSSYIVNAVFACMSAAVLSEICSALPISGSLYIWAAQAAGPKYGRLVGFIVAWWAVTAWMTFTAGCSQAFANYILSLVPVFDLDFPGGISGDNVKWRALLWIVSELFLIVATALVYLPPRWYPLLFRTAVGSILLDWILCMTWLPIGASKRYGLRSAREAFLTTYNGTGASPGWNWALSFFFTSSALVGFDGAGHVAEETKDAGYTSARSIIGSALATAIGGFTTLIVFLFCTPDIDTLFSLNAPQPFVLIYSMALGRGGAVAMTAIAAIQLLVCTSILIITASRLIFAIARDGALPFSEWVGRVSSSGRPQNAVLVMYFCCALLICTILPSTAAFTSLLSGGIAPLVASYGLIALLRLTMTPTDFKMSRFPLGRASTLFYFGSAAFNAWLFAVNVAPYSFPVAAETFNFACVIFGTVTILGFLSFWFTPADRWLRSEQMQRMHNGASSALEEKEIGNEKSKVEAD
ncbi:hypothetical protein BOTBODRAFT_417470 [Botryobasidium botryosum FD-172 SS1]|uniref:Amino acid permease/ SLC12A domain-containing protein n=1 Tax=Botryobasidium botryosum (strain FD-172 SS1) TaxID=930990 RepID=A0A067MAB9_BOTB1|nr:hypothetical protein BOTBODRAFT_417470 [Botryobasidium botryosum FD-172 SS1]